LPLIVIFIAFQIYLTGDKPPTAEINDECGAALYAIDWRNPEAFSFPARAQ